VERRKAACLAQAAKKFLFYFILFFCAGDFAERRGAAGPSSERQTKKIKNKK
jgi:hypothetical protein